MLDKAPLYVLAALYGGPGLAFLFRGEWVPAAIGLACGGFILWFLEFAYPTKKPDVDN